MDKVGTEYSVSQYAGSRIVTLVASHLDLPTPTLPTSSEYTSAKNKIITTIAGGLPACSAANSNYCIDNLPLNCIPIDRENFVDEIALFNKILMILQESPNLNLPFEGALSVLIALILAHVHAYFHYLEEMKS